MPKKVSQLNVVVREYDNDRYEALNADNYMQSAEGISASEAIGKLVLMQGKYASQGGPINIISGAMYT